MTHVGKQFGDMLLWEDPDADDAYVLTRLDAILYSCVLAITAMSCIANLALLISVAGIKRLRTPINAFMVHHLVLDVFKSIYVFTFCKSIFDQMTLMNCTWLGSSYIVIVTVTAFNLLAITINDLYHFTNRLAGISLSSFCCVMFGIIIVWVSSIIVNLGIAFIPTAPVFHRETGVCTFTYGIHGNYMLHFLWILIITLALVLNAFYLRQLRKDLHEKTYNRILEFIHTTTPIEETLRVDLISEDVTEDFLKTDNKSLCAEAIPEKIEEIVSSVAAAEDNELSGNPPLATPSPLVMKLVSTAEAEPDLTPDVPSSSNSPVEVQNNSKTSEATRAELHADGCALEIDYKVNDNQSISNQDGDRNFVDVNNNNASDEKNSVPELVVTPVCELAVKSNQSSLYPVQKTSLHASSYEKIAQYSKQNSTLDEEKFSSEGAEVTNDSNPSEEPTNQRPLCLPHQTETIKDSETKQTNSTNDNEPVTVDENSKLKKANKTVKRGSRNLYVLSAMLVLFIVFWYPLFLLTAADYNFHVPLIAYKILLMLGWTHSITTPVIFFIYNLPHLKPKQKAEDLEKELGTSEVEEEENFKPRLPVKSTGLASRPTSLELPTTPMSYSTSNLSYQVIYRLMDEDISPSVVSHMVELQRIKHNKKYRRMTLSKTCPGIVRLNQLDTIEELKDAYTIEETIDPAQIRLSTGCLQLARNSDESEHLINSAVSWL